MEKINKIILRLYPLNGDQNFGGIYSDVLSELRKTANAKTGELVINSPKSTEGVIKIIEDGQGTVNPILKVTYPDRRRGTIKSDEISERAEIEFGDENVNDLMEIVKDWRKN